MSAQVQIVSTETLANQAGGRQWWRRILALGRATPTGAMGAAIVLFFALLVGGEPEMLFKTPES